MIIDIDITLEALKKNKRCGLFPHLLAPAW